MSLLERQLKQQEQDDKGKVVLRPPAETPANGDEAPPGSLVPALIPVREAVQPSRPAPARTAAREELLHDIRVRLQTQVINAFNTLLDGTPTDTRTKIEAIV